MHPVLQRSAELYARAKKSYRQKRFLTYVKRIDNVISNNWSDRQAFFSEAQQLRAKADPKALRHLWIFSHSSLAVFEEFILDALMRKTFADVLDMVEEPRLFHPAIEFSLQLFGRNVTKRASNPDLLPENKWADTANYFFGKYENLLRRRDLKYFVEKESVVELVPMPQMDEESAARLIPAKKREFAPQHFKLHAYSMPFRVLHSGLMLSDFIDAIAERIDVVIKDVEWKDQPADWRSVDRLSYFLMQAAEKGYWPLFREVPREVMSAKRITMCYNGCQPSVIKEVFESRIGDTVDWEKSLRRTMNGRLPVGLKLHFTKPTNLQEVFKHSMFKLEGAANTVILPPLGSIEVVAEILERIEKMWGQPILGNPDVQIQVCSGVELDQRYAALLGICFYLGSDKIRRYRSGDFVTSHSETGGRLVVYGVPGMIEREFAWWDKDHKGKLVSTDIPYSITRRTDVLTCTSLLDIDNVNLISTLLGHSQHNGFWGDMGRRFAVDVENLLKEHDLSGLLAVDWIFRNEAAVDKRDRDGTLFFDMFSELMEYAFAEYERIEEAKKRGDTAAAENGILLQMQNLLQKYRAEHRALAQKEQP